jgi:hypothetical protein
MSISSTHYGIQLACANVESKHHGYEADRRGRVTSFTLAVSVSFQLRLAEKSLELSTGQWVYLERSVPHMGIEDTTALLN